MGTKGRIGKAQARPVYPSVKCAQLKKFIRLITICKALLPGQTYETKHGENTEGIIAHFFVEGEGEVVGCRLQGSLLSLNDNKFIIKAPKSSEGVLR